MYFVLVSQLMAVSPGQRRGRWATNSSSTVSLSDSAAHLSFDGAQHFCQSMIVSNNLLGMQSGTDAIAS